MKEKTQGSREELFERTPVWNAIFTLTIPMIISSVIAMVYNLSDTFFVGVLNDPLQNAAVTLAAPVMTLFYAVTNLFGIGASSLMSRALGEKDIEKVRQASSTGLFFAAFCAILLSVITTVFNTPILNICGTDEATFAVTRQYMFWTVNLGSVPGIMSIMFGYLLRAEGQAMHASIGQISGCVLNIILDPFFILPFGLNMGVAGAGMATFIANCIACGYFLVLLARQKGASNVCMKPKYFTLQKDVLQNIFVVGIPGVFQNILNVLSMTILNNLAAGYGADAVAAIGIANKINQLPIQVVFGFTQGVMPLIGYNYSANNYGRVKETIKKTLILTTSVLLVIMALFHFEGRVIVRTFMDNDIIVAVGAAFLNGFGISLPFMCMDFMVVGISQSFGMGKYALGFSFLRKVFLEIPFLLFLNWFKGIDGIAYAQCATEVTMSVIACFTMLHLLKNARKKSEMR